MPKLSAVAVRTSLIYLLLGFTFGALLLANKGIPIGGWVWALLPAHIEFLLIGWTGQLILGVAFWILPRYPGGSRGNVTLAWYAYIFLNVGIILVILQPVSGAALLLGRLLEGASAVTFATHAWDRVRALTK